MAYLALFVALGGTAYAVEAVTSSEVGKFALRRSPPVTVPANPTNGQYVTRQAVASCNPGEIAITGGVDWLVDRDDAEFFVSESHPGGNPPNVWIARVGADTNAVNNNQFRALAWCLEP